MLLLDEPTRGLDYPAKAVLAEMLRELAADGHAVLVATHDVEFVAEAADEVVVLAEGEVVSPGRTRVVAASPAFAPQVTKMLGPPWLRVDEVVAALTRMSRPAVAPRAPVGAGRSRCASAGRADDADLAAAGAGPGARARSTRRSSSWPCCRW